jgi:ankyrin repeat protein
MDPEKKILSKSLLELIQNEDLEKIQEALGQGVTLDKFLMYAVERGSRKMIEYFLDLGADPSEALPWTVFSVNYFAMEIFFRRGANIRKVPGLYQKLGRKILETSAGEQVDLRIRELILEDDLDIDSFIRTLQRFSPEDVRSEYLDLAFQAGSLQVAKLLILRGVTSEQYSDRVNQLQEVISRERNLVNKAIKSGDLLEVRKLLDEGVDVHLQKELPLRAAVGHGHLEIVRLLLDRGAILDRSILNSAARHSHFQILLLLLERGGKISDLYLKHLYRKEYLRTDRESIADLEVAREDRVPEGTCILAVDGRKFFVSSEDNSTESDNKNEVESD